MAKTVRQLSNIAIDEVSLVDVGANQHAHVVIAKRYDGDVEYVTKGFREWVESKHKRDKSGRFATIPVTPHDFSAHPEYFQDEATGKPFSDEVYHDIASDKYYQVLGPTDRPGGVREIKGEELKQRRGEVKKMDPSSSALTTMRPMGQRNKGLSCDCGTDQVCEHSPDNGLQQDVTDTQTDDQGSPATATATNAGKVVAGWKPGEKKVKKGFWGSLVEKVLDEEFTTSGGANVSIPNVTDFEVGKHFAPDGSVPHAPGVGGAPGAAAPPPGGALHGTPPPPGHPAMPAPVPGSAHPAAPQPPYAHPGLVGPAPTGAPVGAMQPAAPPPAGPLAQPAAQPQTAQLPPEVVSYIQQLEQMVSELQGGDSETGAPSADTNQEDPSHGSDNNGGKKMSGFGKSESYDPDEQDFLVALAKSLDNEEQGEAISKAMELVEKAEARAQQAEEIAKSERDIRLTSEWVSKAGQYDVPVAPSELGPVLKRLWETSTPEDFKVIEKCLTANSNASSMFAEIGKRGESNGSVFDEVSQRAAEYISKGMDAAAAEAAVYENNPALYDAYLRQQAGR